MTEYEIEKTVEELRQNQKVKIEVELNVAEIFAIVSIIQLYRAKNEGKGPKIMVTGEIAALKLHRLFKTSFPRLYILLDNGWNFAEKKD